YRTVSLELNDKFFNGDNININVANSLEIINIPIEFNYLKLDTPYHAAQMSKLGILDSYHQYLTDLHEYEKQQNIQSDTGAVNLNVIQPPVIPKEIEEYAKEYAK
ncbi:MAG: hypothetical protein ACRCTW_07645, partial [Lactococcus garvieae]